MARISQDSRASERTLDLDVQQHFISESQSLPKLFSGRVLTAEVQAVRAVLPEVHDRGVQLSSQLMNAPAFPKAQVRIRI